MQLHRSLTAGAPGVHQAGAGAARQEARDGVRHRRHQRGVRGAQGRKEGSAQPPRVARKPAAAAPSRRRGTGAGPSAERDRGAARAVGPGGVRLRRRVPGGKRSGGQPLRLPARSLTPRLQIGRLIEEDRKAREAALRAEAEKIYLYGAQEDERRKNKKGHWGAQARERRLADPAVPAPVEVSHDVAFARIQAATGLNTVEARPAALA